VTVWNIAIAGGGIIGGVVLHSYNVVAYPWMVLVLLTLALLAVLNAGRAGFPSTASAPVLRSAETEANAS